MNTPFSVNISGGDLNAERDLENNPYPAYLIHSRFSPYFSAELRDPPLSMREYMKRLFVWDSWNGMLSKHTWVLMASAPAL